MSFGIDILKHLFSIAVIIQHMASESRYSIATSQSLIGFTNWVDGAVMGFFFISGFLFRIKQEVSLYIKSQSIRLLTPFFLFSILYAIALWILGKSSLETGISATLSLHGAGMQLYFLPYLLFVTVSYYLIVHRLTQSAKIGSTLLLLSVLLLSCLIFPASTSTGPSYNLVPYYYLAFIIGVIFKLAVHSRHQRSINGSIIVTSLLISAKDLRFLDLFGVLLLFVIIQSVSIYFPEKRIPGSGGVYLMHTPLVNFFISILLTKFGVLEGPNIVCSVIATYFLSLFVSLGINRLFPKLKWLILE